MVNTRSVSGFQAHIRNIARKILYGYKQVRPREQDILEAGGVLIRRHGDRSIRIFLEPLSITYAPGPVSIWQTRINAELRDSAALNGDITLHRRVAPVVRH